MREIDFALTSQERATNKFSGGESGNRTHPIKIIAMLDQYMMLVMKIKVKEKLKDKNLLPELLFFSFCKFIQHLSVIIKKLRITVYLQNILCNTPSGDAGIISFQLVLSSS